MKIKLINKKKHTLISGFLEAISILSSIWNWNLAANLITLKILNGSSLKVIFGFIGVLIKLFLRSRIPLPKKSSTLLVLML
jgi:hypothetical protein